MEYLEAIGIKKDIYDNLFKIHLATDVDLTDIIELCFMTGYLQFIKSMNDNT